MGPKLAAVWTLFEAHFQTNWSDLDRQQRPAIFDLGDRANRPVMPVDVLGDVNNWQQIERMALEPIGSRSRPWPIRFIAAFIGLNESQNEANWPQIPHDQSASGVQNDKPAGAPGANRIPCFRPEVRRNSGRPRSCGQARPGESVEATPSCAAAPVACSTSPIGGSFPSWTPRQARRASPVGMMRHVSRPSAVQLKAPAA